MGINDFPLDTVDFEYIEQTAFELFDASPLRFIEASDITWAVLRESKESGAWTGYWSPQLHNKVGRVLRELAERGKVVKTGGRKGFGGNSVPYHAADGAEHYNSGSPMYQKTEYAANIERLHQEAKVEQERQGQTADERYEKLRAWAFELLGDEPGFTSVSTTTPSRVHVVESVMVPIDVLERILVIAGDKR